MKPSLKDLPVKVGDHIAGKYCVEQVIGIGGMGAVVAARHEDLGELRAIKFMLDAASQDESAVERFLREARAAVRLKSEHVARILDVGRFPSGEPYIVMEHLEGHDLKQEYRLKGPLPPGEVVEYVLQAVEALAEAHRQGIVHRDLKPANLFLTRRNDGRPLVKVLDFGISKLTGELAKTSGELTGTSALLGSPNYMSPEQMTSSRDIDARADIWALGVILYELLSGKRPFGGETITAIAVSVTSDVPEPPTKIRHGIPDGLSAVIMRCLEKDPQERFANVAELADALAPFTSEDQRSLIAHTRRVHASLDEFSVDGSGPLPRLVSSEADKMVVTSTEPIGIPSPLSDSEPPTALWDPSSGKPVIPGPPSVPGSQSGLSTDEPAPSSLNGPPSIGSGSWTGSGSLGTQLGFELGAGRNRSTLVLAVAGALGVVGLLLVIAFVSGDDPGAPSAAATGAAPTPTDVTEPAAPAVEASAEVEIAAPEPTASAEASASASAAAPPPDKKSSGTSKQKRPIRRQSGHDPFGESWR